MADADADSARRRLLRSSPLFARLGDGEADAILAHAKIGNFAEGTPVFAKGEPGDSMMAVLSGRVTISAPPSDGRQVVLSVVRAGEVFGEIALLDGKERTATATAATDCELLVVRRRDFLSVLRRQPELCLPLLMVFCERLRRTDEQVEDLAFLDLETRLAKTLLRLAEEQNGGVTSGAAGVKISQRALGEIVGSSRESVNKHLQDWKRAGLIAIGKGAIQIRDVAAFATS
jgi:CRP/FNR family transcriptional regulator, cyclic AMP receptor protein